MFGNLQLNIGTVEKKKPNLHEIRPDIKWWRKVCERIELDRKAGRKKRRSKYSHFPINIAYRRYNRCVYDERMPASELSTR